MTATLTAPRSRVQEMFSFPNPVNEVSARLVAAGVVVLALSALAFDARWIVPVMAYGFIARVFSGPTLSPLGQLVTRVLTPLLPVEARPVPGPPKRFAQLIGAAFTVTATVLVFGFNNWGAAQVLLGILVVFAVLESAFGFCAGCKAFAVLRHFGIIPDDVCERCDNIWGASRG